MAIIREPEGIDFVVEPHVLTDEDRRIVAEHIRSHKTKQRIESDKKVKIFAKVPKKMLTFAPSYLTVYNDAKP